MRDVDGRQLLIAVGNEVAQCHHILGRELRIDEYGLGRTGDESRRRRREGAASTGTLVPTSCEHGGTDVAAGRRSIRVSRAGSYLLRKNSHLFV